LRPAPAKPAPAADVLFRAWTGGEYLTGTLEITGRDEDFLRPSGHPVEGACADIRLAVRALDAFAAKKSAENLGLGLVRYDGHGNHIVHAAESTRASAILGSLSGA
jgi:hypothetical protein